MVTEGDKVMLPANLGLIGASRMAPQQTQHQHLLLHSIQEDGSSQVLSHSPFRLFSHDRLIVQGYPNGCQHRFTSPAEAEALPREGASAHVIYPLTISAQSAQTCRIIASLTGSYKVSAKP